MAAISPYHEQLEYLLGQLRNAASEDRPHWRAMIDALTATQEAEQQGMHATWDDLPEYVQNKLAYGLLCSIRRRINDGTLQQ